MSKIRGTNTKIDLIMKRILTDIECRFQMYPKIYGNPDFALSDDMIAIFCDGDFWHGYRYAKKKKPSKKFWRDKIEENMRRDRKITRKLRSDGWSVLRFWEHEIEKSPDKCRSRIIKKIESKASPK